MSPRLLLALLSLSLGSCNPWGEDKGPRHTGADGGDGADGADTSTDSGDGWRPERVCPGDAGCESNEGPLRAGAAARTITPPCFESWTDLDGNAELDSGEDFLDCGCDRLCPGDDGYTAPDDGEGDGAFQAIWMAGFQNGRPATGVHDDLWARAIVFESGETRVGIVSLDLVGFFYGDVLRVREAVDRAGADLDLLVVQSTHGHEGPDTMGQWGPTLTETGKDPAYVQHVVDQAAAAVAEAASALEPATLTIGQADTAAPFGDKGTRNLIRDSRDPVIIDEILYVAHFAGADGETIGTFVNWGNHPETVADENSLITSDYPHYLRESVENGVEWETAADSAGLGGVCIFSNAAVGGMMTSLGVTVTDADGVDHSGHGFDKVEAIGKLVGQLAIGAVASGEVVESPTVSFRTQTLYIKVHNQALQLAHALGVLERDLYNYDPDLPINDGNRPEVLTEVGVIDLGPMRMLAIPGELLPELAVGGYDGSRVNTTEDTLIDPENPNPPDLSQAPEGPYYKDLMGAEYNLVLGLANDELGYLVPEYNYELHPTSPYLSEAEGHHYEETNSLGPEAVPQLSAMVEQLTTWAAPNR